MSARAPARMVAAASRCANLAPPAAEAQMGHNGGPPFDLSWNAWVWRRAHAKAWKTPGREIVLLRSRRAADLGLSYRAYTSVLLDRGVRLQGMVLVTDDAPALDDGAISEKLARLANCTLIVCGEPGVIRRTAKGCVTADRSSLRRVLGATAQSLGTSPSAFFLVGWSESHRVLAQSAGCAAFFRGENYFGLSLGQSQ